MKARRFLIIIPLILIFITLTIIRQLAGIPHESTLMKAFADCGAEIISSEITFSGSSINELKTPAELESFYIGISKIMGANMPIKPEKVENESFQGIELNNSNEMKCIYTLKVLRSKLTADKDRCYVTLYIVNSSATTILPAIKSRITNLLHQYGVKTGINTCFTGRYPGRLNNNEMNEICAGIFKRTEARKIDGIRENNLISVSAYSKTMGESVVVDGKRVNLNFAARYNSYEDKTYIWLATPLITTEY